MFARSGLQTFKTKAFARSADREGLEDAALRTVRDGAAQWKRELVAGTAGVAPRKKAVDAGGAGQLVPEMKQLRQEGLSYREIAQRLGVSRPSVIRLLRSTQHP